MIYPITEIKVGLDFGDGIRPLGRLAIRHHIIYFEYNDEFIQKGMEISPLRLPLKKGVTELPLRPFDGLAGVFNDSLPDGWGQLLFDRMLRSQRILLSDISPLDRLAHVGISGLGALVYEPDNSSTKEDGPVYLDQLATQMGKVLEGGAEDVINELLALNGSSGGARPKALINVDSTKENIAFGPGKCSDDLEPWIVKFPNLQDGPDAGAIEYIYALMAKEAGVSMPEVHLFPSKKGCGYFSVKRFDREGNNKVHMHSVSGLLHSDFRFPSLDYEDLIALTGALTKDIREVEKMYRLAVFNVLAHNRDDHAKNFTFLMNEAGEWKLSPAYDLTFSNGPGGEQSTTVMGEGRSPVLAHLIRLGNEAKLPKGSVEDIISQTKDSLTQWRRLARQFNITQANAKLIGAKIT